VAVPDIAALYPGYGLLAESGTIRIVISVPKEGLTISRPLLTLRPALP
jgi:hypothetical protein